MNFYYSMFLGFAIGIASTATLTVKLEKQTWNEAIELSALQTIRNSNDMSGLDPTYDIGYDKCQLDSYILIKSFKRE